MIPESVPTVVIVSTKDPEQQMIINASDYNPDEHTLWDEKDAPKKPSASSASPKGGASSSPPPLSSTQRSHSDSSDKK